MEEDELEIRLQPQGGERYFRDDDSHQAFVVLTISPRMNPQTASLPEP